MTLEEYFAQSEYYFSESAQDMVPLEQMPFPHALYACQKLHREHSNEFVGTRLYEAFMKRLLPSAEKIRSDLRQYGKASCCHWGNTQAVRSRLYYAARTLGVSVTTHKEKDWITATVTSDVTARVKGVKVA